jgi:serine protease Do
MAAYLLASLSAGALGGIAVTRYSQSPLLQNGASPQAQASLGNSSVTLSELRREELQTIDVVRHGSPAVVSIVITKELSTRAPDDFFTDLFNNRFVPAAPTPQTSSSTKQTPKQRLRVGGGSGFLVAADGYIVTNKHVVDDKDAEYTIVLQDKRQFTATVLALDPSLDLAILKIDGTGFPFLPLGDSNKLEIGQTVIAIGNALSEFENTVTKGIVSGVNRHLVAGTRTATEVIEGAIQTDAAINPGNSGGPLIDLQGEVVGVNTAVSENAQSLGFALPINVVKQAFESVKRTGKIVRPWIGVRYIPIDKELSEREHLPQPYGVWIQPGNATSDVAIIPGSPAAKAGLKEKDVILEVNGQKLDDTHSLSSLVTSFAPGDEVELKIVRNGKEQLLKIKLEERT